MSDEDLTTVRPSFESPLLAGASPGSSSPPLETIGRYRIRRLLGEGGMGVVYEAEQEEPRRTVALKLIKSGLASPELFRRFRQEAQALGRLQHPGIAQIYEAGMADTASGKQQPYFAMEFVSGESLRDYVESHQLNTRERMDIMAKVSDAVHHAHQRGLIHRDLKPGNIIVDKTGQPKILDFGVARATDSDPEATLQTFQGQLLGTLQYMSPEQIAADPFEVDTRSDVYALGVILYELLAERLPYDIGGKLAEAVRAISEQDPAPLSTINRTYRGDIETIVAKALNKDKVRRYDSAAELAADIRRYLNNEAIAARPPTLNYQLQKFARRHMGLVAGIAAVFVVLVAGILASSWQAIRATRAEHDADLRRGQAEDLINFMLGDLRAKLAGVGRLEILDDVGDKALGYFASIPVDQIDGDEMFRRSKALGQIGEVRSAMGDLKAALNAFQESLALAAEVVKRNPKNGEWLIGLATAHFNVGNTFRLQGRLDETLSHFRIYQEIGQKLVALDPGNLNYQLELSFGHSNVAAAYEALGDLSAALKDLEITLRIKQELAAARPENLDWQLTTASTHNRIGFVLERLGRLPEALEHYRRDIAIKDALTAKDSKNTSVLQRLGTAHGYAGTILEAMGDVDSALRHFEAEEQINQALSSQDPANADWKRNFAFVESKISAVLRSKGGSIPGAIDRARLAVSTIEPIALNNPTNLNRQRDHANCRVTLAEAYFGAGKLELADSEQRRATRILEEILEKNSKDMEATRILSAAYDLAGRIHARRGNLPAANGAWTRALESIRPLAVKSQDRRVLDPYVRALLHLNRVEDARPFVERLRRLNYRNREFLSLLQKHGILEKTS